MQGPRRPPTADELLQVPLHEKKGHPPIVLVRIRDTPPPKMAVCDRAVPLIRTRPRHAPRLRPSTARLGVLHPAPASPRAVRARRRRTTSGRADQLRTKKSRQHVRQQKIPINLLRSHQGTRLGCFGADAGKCHFSPCVPCPLLTLFMLTTSMGDSRVDLPWWGALQQEIIRKRNLLQSSSKRGLPLLDNPL